MFYLLKNRFLLGLIELVVEVTFVLIMISAIFGTSVNERGEITSINGDEVNYIWEDKYGNHNGQFLLFELGEDKDIAQVGDKLKLKVKKYGLLDKFYMTLNLDSNPFIQSNEFQKATVVGLDIWFFHRWFR